MVDTLKLYNRLKDKPLGKKIFSMIVCYVAPYFGSISPKMTELRNGYGTATLRKRRRVTNHLNTVHAIAMCNLCEFTAGLTIDASLPKHLRWIPVSMEVFYLKKAKTNLTASCQINIQNWDEITDCPIEVSVKDTNQTEVMKAVITMRVSKKKK